MLGGKSSERDHLPEWRLHEFGSVLSMDVASRDRGGQPSELAAGRCGPAQRRKAQAALAGTA
jgi:hypothetical protein